MEASQLKAPKGISVAKAAEFLQYSRSTVHDMIRSGEIVAWQPRPGRGRKWLVDEVSLAVVKARSVSAARQACAPVVERYFQMSLNLR